MSRRVDRLLVAVEDEDEARRVVDALLHFKQWTRSRMRALGVSQRELALRAGLDHSTVCRIVRPGTGPRQVQLDTALKIVNALL